MSSDHLQALRSPCPSPRPLRAQGRGQFHGSAGISLVSQIFFPFPPSFLLSTKIFNFLLRCSTAPLQRCPSTLRGGSEWEQTGFEFYDVPGENKASLETKTRPGLL